jgi:4-amino-4-deoxy-L-arabinose transferase-like glycosyltransferase
VAGKAVSTLMGSLLVIPLYLLGKEIFSKQVGYIASIFAALSPTLVFISGIVLSQSTYITLLITALYLCWLAFNINSYKFALIAGLMFGVSYLTRPEAVIILVGISLVFYIVRPNAITTKDNLKLILYICIAFFIIAFPYIILLHKVNGAWQLTGKSSVTLADSLSWYLNRPDLKREPSFAGLTYFDIIKQYPDFLLKNTVKNISAVWSELQPRFWLIALLGLVSAFFSTKKWRRILFIGATFLPLGVIIVFFSIDANYFSPYIPILFILGGNGLTSLEKWFKWGLSSYTMPKLVEFVPLLIGTAMAIAAIKPSLLTNRNVPYEFSQDGARYDHKLIGLMLKKILPPKSRVMSKSGRIVFYGDFQQVDIPQTNLFEIIQTAKNGKARYLIIDGTLFRSRPQLEPFFTPLLIPQEQISTSGPFGKVPNIPDGIRLIYLYKNPASVGVAVYEF